MTDGKKVGPGPNIDCGAAGSDFNKALLARSLCIHP